jgi:hypothetical protein
LSKRHGAGGPCLDNCGRIAVTQQKIPCQHERVPEHYTGHIQPAILRLRSQLGDEHGTTAARRRCSHSHHATLLLRFLTRAHPAWSALLKQPHAIQGGALTRAAALVHERQYLPSLRTHLTLKMLSGCTTGCWRSSSGFALTSNISKPPSPILAMLNSRQGMKCHLKQPAAKGLNQAGEETAVLRGRNDKH